MVLLLLLGGVVTGQGQYTLRLNAGYTSGFNTQTMMLANESLDQKWHKGYSVNIRNGFRLKESAIEITSLIGMKHLRSSGTYLWAPFETETYKMVLGLGTLYHFDNYLKVGVAFLLENNLDFDNFISQQSDLFRYAVQGEFYYPITEKWDASFRYSIAMTPLSDHYLITNPQHQIQIGLTYQVL